MAPSLTHMVRLLLNINWKHFLAWSDHATCYEISENLPISATDLLLHGQLTSLGLCSFMFTSPSFRDFVIDFGEDFGSVDKSLGETITHEPYK